MATPAGSSGGGAVPSGVIAVVLKGYPRLSETFIAQELLALERAGLRLALFSLRRPSDPARHPIHDEIAAPVAYLPEYLKDAPGRVARAWARARRLPGYAAARSTFRRDFKRDRSANRVRRFGQACVLAAELPAEVTHLYAHFLHTPASVARYAALMRGLPWSVSAHAKDIWTTPAWEKREKLTDARWAVTCTQSGREHLAALAPDEATVALAYHGLDLARFPPPAAARASRDGSDPNDPLIILSVGRLVAKKGTEDLLHGLSRLPSDMHWRLVHIGDGPLRASVTALADELKLTQRIDWRGAQPQDAVLAAYRAADLFVLASRIAEDGDRDGLPNVLMEAQSQALPCIATRVSAIPELIENGKTGLLVPPGDPTALSLAMDALSRDPQRRARLGLAGCRRVHGRFGIEPGIATLLARFGHGTASTHRGAAPAAAQ